MPSSAAPNSYIRALPTSAAMNTNGETMRTLLNSDKAKVIKATNGFGINTTAFSIPQDYADEKCGGKRNALGGLQYLNRHFIQAAPAGTVSKSWEGITAPLASLSFGGGNYTLTLLGEHSKIPDIGTEKALQLGRDR